MRPRRFALLFAALLAGTSSARAQTCAPDPALDYVCGAEKPEDLVALPGGRWLVASGFAEGAGLKLVDRPARRLTRWYTAAPDQLDWNHAAFPACSGPLDPRLFNARGLGLHDLGRNRARLLVVNHGGRQSVEVFDIEMLGTMPTLRWRGCLPMPEGQVGNAVASFADGTMLVTVLTRPGTSIADFVQGRVTGGVWQWKLGDAGFTLLPGTELPGNNGIDVDPDQRHFHVIAFGWHALLTYDRLDTSAPVERIDAADFMPDNVHWSGHHLLLAGMRLDEPACGGLRKVVDGVADPMLCHRSWIVGELDRAHRRITTIASGAPQLQFNGLSTALIAGDELWLGSFQSDRLAIVRNWKHQQ